MYRVLRGVGFNSRVLRLRGREFPRGSVVDPAEFPDVIQDQWDRWKAQRLITDDEPMVQRRDREVPKSHYDAAARRQAEQVARMRGMLKPVVEPVVAEEPVPCPEEGCEFIAKNPHGLKVHTGRSHKS